MLIKYHKWSKKPRASTVFVRDKKSHFLKKTYWISIVKNDKGSQNCIRRKMHINMFKNDMHVITHSAFSHEVSVMEKTQNFGYDEKSPYFWRIGVFENKKPSEFPFFSKFVRHFENGQHKKSHLLGFVFRNWHPGRNWKHERGDPLPNIFKVCPTFWKMDNIKK